MNVGFMVAIIVASSRSGFRIKTVIEPEDLMDSDRNLITSDWDVTNQRRLGLIEKKAAKTIQAEEKEELQQLQRLAGLKRELLSATERQTH
jgi:hypothetical protein